MAQLSGKTESMNEAKTKLDADTTTFIDNLTDRLSSVKSKVEGSEWAGGALTAAITNASEVVTQFNTKYQEMQARGDKKLDGIVELLRQMDTEFTSTAGTSVGELNGIANEVDSLMP